jgi:hypothetical protein
MTDKFWKFFTSLRLTVVCLGFGILLVFLGTLAQVHEGLWNAQTRWFKEPVVIRQVGDPWWVPPIFPGGYTIGVILLLNLIAAHIKRFKFTWRQAGINLTHFGVILLLVGQLATDKLMRETMMDLREGQPKVYSEAHRDFELVFQHPVDGGNDEVVAIPSEMLKAGAELRHEKLPFLVQVKSFWRNSEPQFRAPMQQNAPPITENGIAKDWDFREMPEAHGMDDRNLPTGLIALRGNAGEDLGAWVVSSWAGDSNVAEGVQRSYARSVGADVAASIGAKLTAPQEFEAGGIKWRVSLRPVRTYKDFSVTLLKTTHEVYPGTEIPKNFNSRVRIDNPAKGEQREAEIYMNNPLRYQGLTFYQSTMSAGEGRSGLQVVRNPSWLTPYLGCLIVGLGMIVQFGYHLIGFITKRRSTAVPAAA